MKLQFTLEEIEKILPDINDAITEVSCLRFTKCCDNPSFINQIGSPECLCVNCRKKCRNCKG